MGEFRPPPVIAAAGLAGLDQRAREIFRNLVETYIATGEPVGSRTLAKSNLAGLSPASIRNVLMDLEDTGLVYAPHAAAGRLPTQAGLRFFVDALLQLNVMDGAERARMEKEIAAGRQHHRPEDVLGEASTMLSGLSQTASMVLRPKFTTKLQ